MLCAKGNHEGVGAWDGEATYRYGRFTWCVCVCRMKVEEGPILHKERIGKKNICTRWWYDPWNWSYELVEVHGTSK